ncbi:response regulator [Cylindrospermum sp. FACHB-282]|uniref:response regulator n=1 Tax=Cylindrospermum sp. FACHB-282 TaxID=2692794 RepID=UPI0016887152|nr:response regulator [Cylindrospermum sp. FACHB-282]MBD2387806.1 response regulator [Cylindrospermum sp. FACHB-282]
MSQPLNVLIVEDSEADAMLVLRELHRGGFNPIWERVQTAQELSVALNRCSWDVILSDYRLPGFNAPAALEIVKQSQKDIPFILISGIIGEVSAVEMMKAGAHDYVMKDNLNRLPEAVRREMRDAQVRAERKQAQAELESQRIFLRQVFDVVPNSIFVKDTQGRFVTINQAGAMAYGVKVEEIIGKEEKDLTNVALEQTQHHLVNNQEVMQIGQRQIYPCQAIVNKQGEVRWYKTIVEPFVDTQGVVQGVIGSGTDISDIKQAQAALQHSQKLLQTLASNIPGMIYTFVQHSDSSAGFEYVSFGCQDLLELTPEEVLKNASLYFAQIHIDDRAGYYAAAKQSAQTLKPLSYEWRIVTPSGKLKWVQVNARPEYRENGDIVWHGVLLDVSDRQLAELEREQLLARERHYVKQLQGLTTAALTINFALSVEQLLQVITDQAASIIGTHQSITSMTIDENWAQAITAIYLSDKYAAWRNYDKKPDGSGIYACVCHLNRPMRMTQSELEAHPRWRGFGKEAENHPPMRGWLAVPLVGRDGQNIGLIQLSDKYEGEFTEADEAILVQLAQMASVAVENAQLYKAEQQARWAAEASREEAQAANRIKDEFLAVLSHELRSPLNPILGWSRLLQTGSLDEAKTKIALATIERNAKLQAELIEDLLDVSRILRGKLSLTSSPINLASTIKAAIETVRLATEAKSIRIETMLDSEVGLVSGDSTRLQQVMWNLLSNTVKFTPPGGRVEVRLEKADNQAQITISDSGMGISPEFLPHVFDYFRQADSTTTRQFGGLGLGLAIVRHLVELHGGTIEAESQGEGMGATFTVKLPLIPSVPTLNQDSQLSEPSLDLKGIHVLVVDDETDTRDFVAFLLEQAGARVIASASALEAFTVLTQSQPDVLLSDIGMPEMDGYMLMRQIRALPPEQGGQIPAIALTAYAGDFNHQQALQAGFQQHIAKPIEPEGLIRAISTLLGCPPRSGYRWRIPKISKLNGLVQQ